MKKEYAQATQLVCKGQCSFYKPDDKEDIACKGYEFVDALIQKHPAMVDRLSAIQNKPFQNRYNHTLHQSLCRHCDFFIDGCDFTDPNHHGSSLPCGGYIALEKLLQHEPSQASEVWQVIIAENLYAMLSPKSVLKQLEKQFLYDLGQDELYELDQGGFAFLSRCDGTHTLREMVPDADFLESCLEDNLLELSPSPRPRRSPGRQAPIPSLRYLELQITNRCNLTCRHCYLGKPRTSDMPLSHIVSVVNMFEEMQGLRVLVSGGEPLMHPDIAAMNEAISSVGVRKVLLTNGTLVRAKNLSAWCFFDEIQFSLDGLEKGHDKLRGAGTFERTVKGIEIAQNRGVAVSIATMIHRENIAELEALAAWIEARDIVEWSLDVPCQAGRLSQNPDLLVTPKEGAPFLSLATGGSYHGAEEPFACGHHLCTVTPNGDVLKCGFFPDDRLGNVSEGLEACWKRAHHIPLSELECRACFHLKECKGGCRFRAPTPKGKDPIMCARFGVS